ncbi:3445_t:CDS:2 [Ambispora gerdemannii]|uniref:3445_t:CDS:1 n=1 Tax=Ambispora gerdemannii TaxID=144530 RepID=A0A9N8V432_9GLOM|nr:3445_t:CDS:2 [Ambispora gerdemannii]
MANGEKRLMQEDRMEKRKVFKRRQTVEAPSQLQTPLSTPPSSRSPSPIPPETPFLIPLPVSRPSSPITTTTTITFRDPPITSSNNDNNNFIVLSVFDHDEQPQRPSSSSSQHQLLSTSTTTTDFDKSSSLPTAAVTTTTTTTSSSSLSSIQNSNSAHSTTSPNNSTLSSHLLRLLPIIHNGNLQSLNLSFVKGITNSYLTKLLSPFFANIRTINLAGGSRSDACLSAVIPHCHQVQNLSFAWNTSLSDTSITKIATLCGSRLRTLDLTNCEKVSDRSMSSIAKHCSKLRELRVSYCRGVSEVGVREVVDACDGLTLVDLVGCLGVDRGFLIKCNEEFSLQRRGLKIVWRRDSEGGGTATWADN